jgi:co-chaperonin GroES (HSP10)
MGKKSVIEPLGFYVLIEVEEVKEVSPGGIYTGDAKRDQEACDIGYVRAIGNTAFRGFPGCLPSEYAPGHAYYDMQPHEIWGIKIGDKVEYRKFEGKLSGVKGVKNMRYIPDTQILGKVN